MKKTDAIPPYDLNFSTIQSFWLITKTLNLTSLCNATLPGTFQLSQLNSSSVQKQLKAAGIDTNSKQYKAALKQMMSNANGAMYTNIQGIKNLMKNHGKDGDYIDPTTREKRVL